MYKTCSPVMYQLKVRTAGASFVIIKHKTILIVNSKQNKTMNLVIMNIFFRMHYM